MLPLLIAAAAGTIRAGVGAIQANQEKQRQKGIIGKAYKLGQQRMNLRQQDVRQSVAETSGSRGLTQGGDVMVGGPSSAALTTGVGGARTLGGQQTADLAREQNLEAYGLNQERDRALSDTKAAYTSNLISSVSAGINTAVGAYGAASEAGAMKTGSPAGGGIGPGVQTESPPPGWRPSRFPGAYGGIDPLDPVGRSMASGDFNKFSDANNG